MSVYELGHVSSGRPCGESPAGIRQEIGFGWEVINRVASNPPLQHLVEPSQLASVVFTGPATATCGLQVNKFLPKKEEREHAGVTCFSLPHPLSPPSGAVGTWHGLL